MAEEYKNASDEFKNVPEHETPKITTTEEPSEPVGEVKSRGFFDFLGKKEEVKPQETTTPLESEFDNKVHISEPPAYVAKHEGEEKITTTEEPSEPVGEVKSRGLFDFLGKKEEVKPQETTTPTPTTQTLDSEFDNKVHIAQPPAYVEKHEGEEKISETPAYVAKHEGEEKISEPPTYVAKHGGEEKFSEPPAYAAKHGGEEKISEPPAYVAKHEGEEKKEHNPTLLEQLHATHEEEEENKPSLLHKLHRSNSSSSSSSEEEGEDNEKRKKNKEKKKIFGGEEKTEEEKKGFTEKIKEKLPGHGTKTEVDAPVDNTYPVAAAPVTDHPAEKKGLMEKIKDKLPGHSKKSEDDSPVVNTTAAVPVSEHPVDHPVEKKGFMEKIKEKLPGHHAKGSGEDEKKVKESDY